MCCWCVVAVSDWLPSLGYDYENLVSPMTSDNTTTSSTDERASWSESDQLRTTPCERLGRCVRSVELGERVTVSVRAGVFGVGVLVVDSRPSVTVHLLDSSPLSRLALLLLNNSLFVGTYFNVTDRRQVHHYIKPSSRLRDVMPLRHGDVMTYSGGVTVTVSHVGRHDVHVSVINDVAVLHVRHVTRSHVDVTSERRRLDMTSR